MKFKNYLNEQCPLQTQYGEMLGQGGFGNNTEYEIGAARMAEAAHCILGSLAKLNSDTHFWVEKDHIKEEFGIIEKGAREYGKDLYIDPRRMDMNNSYTQDTIKSVKKNAPKLRSSAESAMRRLDKNLPKEIKRLAEETYKFLIELAVQLLGSINIAEKEGSFGETYNAYSTKFLQGRIRSLKKAYNDFMRLPDEGKMDNPYAT